mmetsp:Transcript_9718/g.29630  ORF Transcript_9718/g.29630 Transcript_9718/m.29630 type:complete len:138 (-) Transcript_9718:77-490(-)
MKADVMKDLEQPLPAYGSVIASVKNWVSALKHLYTLGMEQREPVDIDDPVDTTDTKSEKPLSEYEELIIEVHELIQEVDELKGKRKAEKDAAREASCAQDRAARAAYKKLTEEGEPKKSICLGTSARKSHGGQNERG